MTTTTTKKDVSHATLFMVVVARTTVVSVSQMLSQLFKKITRIIPAASV